MGNMLHAEIAAYLKKHPNKYTYLDLAQRFFPNDEPRAVLNRLHGIVGRAGLRDLVIKEQGGPRSLKKEGDMPRKTKKELTTEARLESQLRAKTRDKQDTDRKYRALQDDLAKTEQALADAIKIMAGEPKTFKIKPTPAKGGGGATCFGLLSDLHVEELVPKHKVNGLNEHNPDIAKRRVSRFFDLLVRFLRVERQESQIDQLVLWLGGDMFTGDMHGVPVAMDVMDAVEFAKSLIVSGLRFILEQEPNLKIHVVCSVGNHSRVYGSLKQVNQAKEQELSLEFIMYHAIKAHFEDVPNLTWQIDRSYMSYLKVYDKTIRFCHGHLGFRYNMGLGGLHGPLWKVISQTWDNQVDADLTCIGHYHSYTPAALARPYVANGSTIGVSPYSLSFGGGEPPAQAFFLVHSRYGLVGQRPLFVDL